MVALAAVAPVAVCAVLSGFRGSVANTNAALGLVLVVVAAAATGIRPAGIAAAVSSALWFNFFLTVPYHSFAITDPADVETAVLLFGVGLAVSEIALWGRRQQAHASRDQGYLHGVLDTAAAVAAGLTSRSALIAEVQARLTELLRLDRCRFVADQEQETALATVRGDGTVVYAGRPYEVARRGLPTDTEIALPARSGGVVRGWYLLTAVTRVVRPSADQLRVAVALADQVGAALVTSDTGPRLSDTGERSSGIGC